MDGFRGSNGWACRTAVNGGKWDINIIAGLLELDPPLSVALSLVKIAG